MRFHHLASVLRMTDLALRNRNDVDGRLYETLDTSQKFYVGDCERLPSVPSIKPENYPIFPFLHTAFELEWSTPGAIQGAIVIAAHLEHRTVMHVWERVSGGLWDFLSSVTLDRELGHIEEGVGRRFVSTLTNSSPKVPWDGPNPAMPQEGSQSFEAAIAVVFHLGVFLQVLNCVNVSTKVIDAPKFLNKKRLAKGKLPIYEYKTLVLRPNATQRLDGGGTHDSPRVHLRRGHIKHRKTGDFWWQPCVVGDPKRGVVMKDYRADELVAS